VPSRLVANPGSCSIRVVQLPPRGDDRAATHTDLGRARHRDEYGVSASALSALVRVSRQADLRAHDLNNAILLGPRTYGDRRAPSATAATPPPQLCVVE